MNEALSLAAAFIAGIMLGAFFFGGLWWTVQKGMTSERVALWFLGSMLLRTGVVVVGFYFVLGDDWRRLVAGLFGFVAARFIVIRLTRSAAKPNPFAQDARHAP
ncbi:MAG: ATP synthase subunit I [Thiobacillus sp.]|nr:ATP synthase subunit I [Thiobacillus sp.]